MWVTRFVIRFAGIRMVSFGQDVLKIRQPIQPFLPVQLQEETSGCVLFWLQR